MKYNCVSGTKRSGTSLLMLVLKQAGVPIIGFKFPMRLRNKDRTRQVDAGIILPTDEDEKANPHGYWEISSVATATGLKGYYKDIGRDGDLIKIPLDVLPLSDQELIGKTIIILRNARKVLSSMWNCDNIVERQKEYWLKCTALKLQHNIIRSVKWLTEHKKEFLIISYENLLNDPQRTLWQVCKMFLQRGEPKYSYGIIDKRLDRSQPITNKLKELDELDELTNTALNNPKEILKMDLMELQNRMKKYK